MSNGYSASAAIVIRRRPKNGTGVNISSTVIRYAESGSGAAPPQSGWSTTFPQNVAQGQFVWTWVNVTYSDGTQTNSYSVSRIGIDGRGIKSSVTTYCQKANTSVTPENFPASDWGAFPASLTDGYWLYSKVVVTYSDNQTAVSYDVHQIGQGSYYAGLQEYYTATATSAMPADYPGKEQSDPQFVNGVATYANGQTPRISSIWKTSIGQVTLNAATPYLWNFEVSRDSKGNKYVTEPRPIGNFAKGITSIVEAYAISASSVKGAGDYPADIDSWSDEAHAVAPTAAKPYQWNREIITYNDGTTSTTYHVSSVRGTNGQNGQDGRDGQDGQNGQDGRDGQDGQDGRDGQDGADGRGISSVNYYRKLTDVFIPPSTNTLNNANGWYVEGSSDCPAAPTESNPYLWQCEWVRYTDNSEQKILRHLQTYSLLPQPNLLEDSAFDSENRLTHWEIHNGEINPDARQDANGFMCTTADVNYREVLLQRLYRPGYFCKLKGGTWYTLSFYSRTRRYVNATSHNYGFPSPLRHEIYLKAGRYKLLINGHCSSAARSSASPVSLRGYLFGPANVGSGWNYHCMAEITTITDKTAQSGEFTVPTGYAGIYKVWFYAFKTDGVGGNEGEDVTINWFQIKSLDDNGRMDTYLYSAAATQPLDAGSTYFVDGKVVHGLPSDGVVPWYLDNDEYPDYHGWTRHSVTFKTKAVIPEAIQNVLFRLFKSYVEICMPKFEESVMPTEWMRHVDDVKLTFSRNPAGTWVQNKYYYYFDGVQDYVYALQSSAQDAPMIPFILIKRTTGTGYKSTKQPYDDPEHWMPATWMKFIACESMFAEEIFSDYIKSKKLLTEGEDTRVSIENGLMQIFGKQNDAWHSNVRLGIVDDQAALLFYNNSDQLLASLGPSGLKLVSVAGGSGNSISLLPGDEYPLRVGDALMIKRDGSIYSTGRNFKRFYSVFVTGNMTLGSDQSWPDHSYLLFNYLPSSSSSTVYITLPAATDALSGLEIALGRCLGTQNTQIGQLYIKVIGYCFLNNAKTLYEGADGYGYCGVRIARGQVARFVCVSASVYGGSGAQPTWVLENDNDLYIRLLTA